MYGHGFRSGVQAFPAVSEASTQLPVLTGEAETQTIQVEDSETQTAGMDGGTLDSDGGQGSSGDSRGRNYGDPGSRPMGTEDDDGQRYEDPDSLWEEDMSTSGLNNSGRSKGSFGTFGDLSRSEANLTRDLSRSEANLTRDLSRSEANPTRESNVTMKGYSKLESKRSAGTFYKRLLGGDMLDQSASELKATVEELERRFEAIDNEGNEWKTRFETQQEMNQQLERQILVLQNKVEEARKNLKEVKSSPNENKTYDDLADASAVMVKQLEKDKNILYNQLRDLEWRLDQESKAYHKANDERKQYVLEINTTKGNISELKRSLATTNVGDASSRTPRDMGGNIPNDQRILDPKKGPIRKTAGVKNLPSLEAA